MRRQSSKRGGALPMRSTSHTEWLHILASVREEGWRKKVRFSFAGPDYKRRKEVA